MNPWKGLSSYTEDDLGKYKFVGRSSITHKLVALIENNLLTTIYGKTGCGKTSIIQAGVFPILRQESYFPMLIRLSLCKNKNYGSFITQRIKTMCAEGGIEIASNGKLDNFTSNDSSTLLWRFFYGHDFKKTSTDEIVFPVIVLDQFEEVFDKQSMDKVYDLLSQLNQLVSDNLRLPEDAYANFRIVLSLREDYLYMLEDSIDFNGFTSLKLNRQRILSLTKTKSMEVIALGDDSINANEKPEIIDKIINLAKDDTAQISTNMLSLICSELYIQSDGNITLKTIAKFSDNPLEKFYLHAIEKISEPSRDLIESKLVTDGRRSLVAKKILKDRLSDSEYKRLTEGESKILQDVSAGSTKYMELIHDSLAKAIQSVQASRIEEKRRKELERKNRYAKRSLIGIGCLAIILVVYGLIFFNSNFNHKSIPEMSINFDIKEDSTVTDLDYWSADFILKGNRSNGNDTILAVKNINKTMSDSLISVSIIPEEFDNISYEIIYDKRYRDIYDNFSSGNKDIEYFKTNPVIHLYAHKKVHEVFPVSGKIQLKLDDIEADIKGALIVVNDQICWTDSTGNFAMKLNERVSEGTPFSVITQGFSYDMAIKDLTWSIYSITPRDSLINFKKSIAHIDSITNWVQYHNSTRGFDFISQSGQSDKMHLNIIIDEKSSKGIRKIYGVYYFDKEKSAARNNSLYYYHIFEGTIDWNYRKSEEIGFNERLFDLTSYDLAGNKQTIKGALVNAKKWFYIKGNLNSRYGFSGTFDSDNP